MSDWRQVSLSEVVTRVTTKNVDGTNKNVLTVSAEHGLIAQESFFTKKVASNDTSGYYVVAPGQFVYNKSTSKSAAYGTVARNRSDEPGIVSPLYFVFQAKDGAALPEYLELALNSDHFFGSLAGMLREGARAHGLLNVRLNEFYAATVTLPPAPMQGRIVEVIGAVDNQIAALDDEAVAGEQLRNRLVDEFTSPASGNVRPPEELCSVIGSGPSWVARDGWVRAPLSRFLALNVEVVDVHVDRTYPTVGVLNRGRGLLYRDPVAGSATAYKKLNRIGPGVLIYSRLKAFEGAITVTPDDLPESFASQEFPTFTFAPDTNPSFFRVLTTTQGIWDALQGASKGMGGRRERVKPADFLNIIMDIPPLPVQGRIVEVIGVVDDKILTTRAEANRLRQVRARLLAGLLDRTIEIESAELEV